VVFVDVQEKILARPIGSWGKEREDENVRRLEQRERVGTVGVRLC
jgi:hypothetical protein